MTTTLAARCGSAFRRRRIHILRRKRWARRAESFRSQGRRGIPAAWERRRRIPSRCCKAFCARNWATRRSTPILPQTCRGRETARLFRALSEEEKRHARDLAAAIYLITGKPYCPRVCVERPDMGDLCALLRALYHGEACAGYNYARAGEETLDLCLGKLFAAMSADEYRHAETLLKLLGRKMNI